MATSRASFSAWMVDATRLIGLLSLCAMAQAATSSSTSTAAAATHTVNVGQGAQFTFNPNSVVANVGDTIEFDFFPSNHSVAQAAYGYPCIPLGITNPGTTGFWSGFRDTTKEGTSLKYSVVVNDTAPIWYYCSAPGACIHDLMVGVINPNNTQTLANFITEAAAAKTQLSPGDPAPTEGGPPPTATTPAPAASSSSSLSTGAIVGIVIGAVAAIAIAGLVFYLCGRNRSLNDVLRYSQPPKASTTTATQEPPPHPHSPSPMSTPYSPAFSHKSGGLGIQASPEMSQHDSWQGHPPPMRNMSPEHATEMNEGRGLMSVGSISPDHRHDSFNTIQTQRPGNVRIQSSPGEAPWSPGGFGLANRQYAQVSQEHEMAAHSGNPGTSPGFMPSNHTSYMDYPISSGEQRYGSPPPVRRDYGPHELDSLPVRPATDRSLPPYSDTGRTRGFSFDEGQEGEVPGVEKLL